MTEWMEPNWTISWLINVTVRLTNSLVEVNEDEREDTDDSSDDEINKWKFINLIKQMHLDSSPPLLTL